MSHGSNEMARSSVSPPASPISMPQGYAGVPRSACGSPRASGELPGPPASRVSTPVRLLLVIACLAALVAVGLPDRLLSQWAYAVERGKLDAIGDDLASVEEVSSAFRKVARLAKPGVVQISVAGDPDELAELRRRVNERFDDPISDERWQRFLREHPQGTASGIVLDESGFVLTNNHVVGGKTGIMVRTEDGRAYEARIIGTDADSDIAVIKIDADNLRPLKFGDSDKMEVGDWVLAVGAPLGLSHTVTHGIISAKGRSDVISGRDIFFQDFFQTDASINRGNSGGPLLNLRGEVIGINTAVALNDDGANAGIAFTIPSNIALRIADQLKRTGAVARGWLGVSLADVNSELVELFELTSENGVMVDSIYTDSPARRAGLECEDIIVEANGSVVTNTRRLQALIGFVTPGQEAQLKVIRDGKPLTLAVRLGRRPDDLNRPVRGAAPENDSTESNAAASGSEDEGAPDAGGGGARPDASGPMIAGRTLPALPFQVRSMQERLPRVLPSRELALQALGLARENERGVLVVGPAERGDGDEMEIRPGELIRVVNGRRVTSVQQLQEALKASEKVTEFELIDSAGVRRTVRLPVRN